MTSTDEEHAHRHRVFLAIVRSRVLQHRLSSACRRSSWLLARTQLLTKQTLAVWDGQLRRRVSRSARITFVRQHRSR